MTKILLMTKPFQIQCLPALLKKDLHHFLTKLYLNRQSLKLPMIKSMMKDQKATNEEKKSSKSIEISTNLKRQVSNQLVSQNNNIMFARLLLKLQKNIEVANMEKLKVLTNSMTQAELRKNKKHLNMLVHRINYQVENGDIVQESAIEKVLQMSKEIKQLLKEHKRQQIC